MFAGKTSEMIRLIRQYSIAGLKCTVIKYSGDTRYTDTPNLATHDDIFFPASARYQLVDAIDSIDKVDVIGIDEAQFFPNLVGFCVMAADQGKVVVVAALNSTFERQPFPQVADLMAQAETVTKLTAVCMGCKGEASFSHRTSDETSVKVVGGADKYEPLCRACYLAKVPPPALPPRQAESGPATDKADASPTHMNSATGTFGP